MKSIKRFFTIAFFSLLFISTANAQSEPTEYLSVGKKIEFNGEDYELKWSSHPSNEYYKQEYLRENDKLPKYEKMLMVEAVKGDIPAINVANGKINELENWKKSNPIVSYEKFENGKEIILEFVLSSGNIYEWNIYIYKNSKTIYCLNAIARTPYELIVMLCVRFWLFTTKYPLLQLQMMMLFGTIQNTF